MSLGIARAIVLGASIKTAGNVISKARWRVGGKKNFVSNYTPRSRYRKRKRR